ncbi:hypothetical protein RF683_03140 [Flavobacterium sp. 20NA77.7]|uniref:DUF3828 domain-containing protein n=1 Tax=Flavobacterium nakdongensis TaxID=3073563 RepID=A0ABY9RB34_9FLAO|nr:hypothetical protein [Flavobacterium sp. 20NA77.7]WMW78457.1 hypothetical protein RF683_03140 [Flavobacterium sp. 20NA77.7]
MRKTALLFYFFSLIFCIGCDKIDEEEATKVVDNFYKIHDQNDNDFRKMDTLLLSRDLIDLIRKTKKREEQEIELIKNSAYPTDKPFTVDGDLFTRVNEGIYNHKILEVKLFKNKIKVLVEFNNKTYKELTNYADVILIPDNGWKVDNIIFKKYEGNKSIQEDLKKYIYDTKLNFVSTN